jgi:preprotein translocase subunit SecF
MIWGIVIGTYSTICVATPMLIYMNIRRGPAEDMAGTPADGAPAGSADAG